jgi:hypothetical protein
MINPTMLTCFVLAYCGLGAISSTMDRHCGHWYGRGSEPSNRSRLRMTLLGWSGIAASFVAAVASDGWHIGPVLWLGALTASALVLTLLLHYAPRHALTLPIAAQLMALLSVSLGLTL